MKMGLTLRDRLKVSVLHPTAALAVAGQGRQPPTHTHLSVQHHSQEAPTLQKEQLPPASLPEDKKGGSAGLAPALGCCWHSSPLPPCSPCLAEDISGPWETAPYQEERVPLQVPLEQKEGKSVGPTCSRGLTSASHHAATLSDCSPGLGPLPAPSRTLSPTPPLLFGQP